MPRGVPMMIPPSVTFAACMTLRVRVPTAEKSQLAAALTANVMPRKMPIDARMYGPFAA
jgi:hypothetical protein